ncbi:DUF1671-domain-containing protein [Polyplosphaeria fusca]|uniref:DUF1671-domain-containing protein n=1 Tax=Polyplosphaeria fusca TaxID=682080 RepID=A0A9P4QUH6_9PLEO|nr:DUF1671-domain-containing protein [Polyplosphaeria fusca]
MASSKSLLETGLLECPMCSYAVLPDASSTQNLQLHFEQAHTTDSPFQILDDPEAPPPLPPRPSSSMGQAFAKAVAPADNTGGTWVECPESECGEIITLIEYNDHLDLHAASTISFDEATGKYHSHKASNMKSAPSGRSNASSLPSFLEPNSAPKRLDDGGRKLKRKHRYDGERVSLSRSIFGFNPFAKGNKIVRPPPSSIRLGRRELGPHAWEDNMPKWLHDQLANGPKITVVNRIGRDGRLITQEVVQNETPGIIPILAQLSSLDRSVREAYYCHPAAVHITKTPKEGGFCGYRNIQMLVSYIQGARAQGHEEFPGRTPGILRLQDMIEKGWDKKINEIGRKQTGGIRNTRKYIGTPEAHTLFLSCEIDCGVELFFDSTDESIQAHEALLSAVESYYTQANADDGSKVHKTLLPPIYLQYEGHSLTIVGLECHKNGSRNLMVFDPSFTTSPGIHQLLGRRNLRTSRPGLLTPYRRSEDVLVRYKSYEILMLVPDKTLISSQTDSVA